MIYNEYLNNLSHLVSLSCIERYVEVMHCFVEILLTNLYTEMKDI